MNDDSIEFELVAKDTVVNNTVKIVCDVVGIVTTDMTEEKLKQSIREVMQRFIKAEWQFSGMQRTSHRSRMEQVTLVASARVPESENFALDRRRDEASQDGMNIATARVDTEPTREQFDELHRKLRKTLLQRIKAEIEEINDITGRNFRMGKIVFSLPDEVVSISSNRPAMAMAASAKTNYGSGFGHTETSDEIGNAVTVPMTVRVKLRADD